MWDICPAYTNKYPRGYRTQPAKIIYCKITACDSTSLGMDIDHIHTDTSDICCFARVVDPIRFCEAVRVKRAALKAERAEQKQFLTWQKER